MERQVECLLQIKGDAIALNTFDKDFRSGPGPRWPDRPGDGKPRYSLHALLPVPEDVQKRGYENAGKLWCPEYWEATDDLRDMQVKRRMGERCYRFFTPGKAPKNVFRYASYRYPLLYLRLTLLERDGGLESDSYHEGYYQGRFSPNGGADFAALRKEMGFVLPWLFDLGQIVATPAALEAVPLGDMCAALDRHRCGDWGDVSPEDKRANDGAVRHGERLWSAYRTEDDMKYHVITMADRSATTILLPDEY